MHFVRWSALPVMVALAAALVASQANAAAQSCTEWKKTGEFWFMRCVDDKKKAVCFTCQTKQVSKSCKMQEGAICASR